MEGSHNIASGKSHITPSVIVPGTELCKRVLYQSIVGQNGLSSNFGCTKQETSIGRVFLDHVHRRGYLCEELNIDTNTHKTEVKVAKELQSVTESIKSNLKNEKKHTSKKEEMMENLLTNIKWYRFHLTARTNVLEALALLAQNVDMKYYSCKKEEIEELLVAPSLDILLQESSDLPQWEELEIASLPPKPQVEKKEDLQLQEVGQINTSSSLQDPTSHDYVPTPCVEVHKELSMMNEIDKRTITTSSEQTREIKKEQTEETNNMNMKLLPEVVPLPPSPLPIQQFTELINIPVNFTSSQSNSGCLTDSNNNNHNQKYSKEGNCIANGNISLWQTLPPLLQPSLLPLLPFVPHETMRPPLAITTYNSINDNNNNSMTCYYGMNIDGFGASNTNGGPTQMWQGMLPTPCLQPPFTSLPSLPLEQQGNVQHTTLTSEAVITNTSSVTESGEKITEIHLSLPEQTNTINTNHNNNFSNSDKNEIVYTNSAAEPNTSTATCRFVSPTLFTNSTETSSRFVLPSSFSSSSSQSEVANNIIVSVSNNNNNNNTRTVNDDVLIKTTTQTDANTTEKDACTLNGSENGVDNNNSRRSSNNSTPLAGVPFLSTNFLTSIAAEAKERRNAPRPPLLPLRQMNVNHNIDIKSKNNNSTTTCNNNNSNNNKGSTATFEQSTSLAINKNECATTYLTPTTFTSAPLQSFSHGNTPEVTPAATRITREVYANGHKRSRESSIERRSRCHSESNDLVNKKANSANHTWHYTLDPPKEIVNKFHHCLIMCKSCRVMFPPGRTKLQNHVDSGLHKNSVSRIKQIWKEKKRNAVERVNQEESNNNNKTENNDMCMNDMVNELPLDVLYPCVRYEFNDRFCPLSRVYAVMGCIGATEERRIYNAHNSFCEDGFDLVVTTCKACKKDINPGNILEHNNSPGHAANEAILSRK